MSPDEIIDIYDENLLRLGQLSRDEVHTIGAWHRTFHCWIIRPSEDGFVLFQKRSRTKDLFPNLLDITAAGHYLSGETAEHGVREIYEELGLSVNYSELIPLGIKIDVTKTSQIINREFSDVFLLKRHEAPREYSVNSDEVEGLLQIRITDGLSLFSGETRFVNAAGVKWNARSKKWMQVKLSVTKSDFFPRIDCYYYKIFIIAKKFLEGDRYLSI